MSTFSLALGWWGSVVMLVVIGLSVFGVCMSASVVVVVEGPRCTTCTTLCSHLTQYGVHYHTSKLVQVMGDTDSHRPMLECYDNCACDPVRCGNRVVQAGPVNNLQVVEVGNKGLG